MKRNQQDWAGFVAVLGVGALLAGWLRYSTQGELLLASKILLIAGGVLVLGGVGARFPADFGLFLEAIFAARDQHHGAGAGRDRDPCSN